MVPREISMVGKPPLGTLITVHLRKIGKTQKWLAEDINVSSIYLCAVMAGRANPTLKLLRRIAKSLDIDMKDFVDILLSEENPRRVHREKRTPGIGSADRHANRRSCRAAGGGGQRSDQDTGV